MLAREETMKSEHLKGDLDKVISAVNTRGFDSAMLDNTLEFLYERYGITSCRYRITIRAVGQKPQYLMPEKERFLTVLRNNDGAVDGPASILFSDGDIMGARYLTETVFVRQDTTFNLITTFILSSGSRCTSY